MKTLILLALVITCNAATAQTCKKPIDVDRSALYGSWNGHYTMNGELCPLVITIEDSSGDLFASIAADSNKAQKSEIEISSCGSLTLHFDKIKVNGAALEFEGHPKKGTMTGYLTVRKPGGFLYEEVFSVTLNKGL